MVDLPGNLGLRAIAGLFYLAWLCYGSRVVMCSLSERDTSQSWDTEMKINVAWMSGLRNFYLYNVPSDTISRICKYKYL